MPLIHPPRPHPGLLLAIGEHLQKLFKKRAILPPKLRDLRPSALMATEAFRVYTLGLDAMEKPNLLASATPRKWRVLLQAGGRTVAEIDVVVEPPKPPHIVGIHQGPRAEAMDKAIKVAEGLRQITRGDFELRLLEAPALHFVALWLHGGKHGDVVLPIPPNRTPLPNLEALTEDGIAGVLREHAASIRAGLEAARGDSGG